MAGGIALNCVANTPHLAGDAVRGRLGAARRRRRRHGARRRPAAVRRRRRARRPVHHGRARPRVERRRAGRLAAPRQRALHDAGGHRRRGGRGARRRRCGRLVRRSQRVRAPRARATLAHGAPRPVREPRTAQRRQGPRAVPSGRADGADRPRAADLQRRPDPQPLHAVRAHRQRLGGENAFRLSSTSTARPASRPSTTTTPRTWPRCCGRSRRAPDSPSWSTPASTPPGRPMVDDPRDALELFGSAPVDALVLGPHLVRRRDLFDPGGRPMTADTDLQYAVVVPTVGRPSLHRLLAGLARARGPAPAEVVVVDDRDGDVEPLEPRHGSDVRPRRPGAARLRARPRRRAQPRLAGHLRHVGRLPGRRRRRCARPGATTSWPTSAPARPDVAATQARLHVPLPRHRRPTDWERSTAGLEEARWATADMAYRREALARLHGFDERFPRAYREDADLALRVRDAGWRLQVGTRTTVHPVRPAGDLVSVRAQRGNADDALMGGAARSALAGPRGGRHGAAAGWHLATVGAGAAVAGRSRRGGGVRGSRTASRLAGAGAAAWLGLSGGLRPPPHRPRPPRRRRGAPHARHERRDTACGSVAPGTGWVAASARGRVAPAAAGGALRPRRHARARRAVQRRPRAGEAGRRRRGGAGPVAAQRDSPRRGHQPVGRRARPAHPHGTSTRSTGGSRSCSGRSTPGRSARTRPRSGCACRKPRPGMVLAAAPDAAARRRATAPWSATSAPTSRPPGRPVPGPCWCPRRRHPPGRGPRRALRGNGPHARGVTDPAR